MEFPIKRTRVSQNFQFPDENEVVFESSPTFIWIPLEETKEYKLSVFDENKKLIEEVKTHKSFANISSVLSKGKYYWSVESDLGAKRDLMLFEIAENAINFERPSADEVYDNIPLKRPYYLFCESDIEEIKKDKKDALITLKNNVKEALKRPLPSHPVFHRAELVYTYRDYYAEYRLHCDRDLMALSLSYALENDEEAGEKGKLLLLEICSMNPLGPCAIDWDFRDEVGCSNIRCLPVAFDLLYPLLAEKERKYVASTIAVYAKQCENKLKRVDFEKNPSDSHVGRIPAYLGGAAIVLKGENVVSEDELKNWLEIALDIYCGIFPYYGGNDGSWAEGTFYSTSYTKWYIPFFAAVERFCGKSLFNRPFYHRYTNFLIHFCNKDYEIHPFSDGYWCTSDSKEWPGFFAQNPYNIYAEKFGPELAVKREKECLKQDIYMLHLLDIFLPKLKKEEPSLAKEPTDVEVFKDGGFVAIHSDLYSPDDIALLARASRFSYDSHRHADQGSFALFSGGVALISPSGYFGRDTGSKHHIGWTKTTIAHNTLLFNGVDQTSVDKLNAVGKIISVDEEKKSCVLDMSEAYSNIDLWQRCFKLSGNVLTVCDTVEAKEDVEVLYPLHTLSEPKEENGTVIVERKGKKLTIKPMDNCLTLDRIDDKFGVDLNEGALPEHHITMPPQYHIYYKSKKSKTHKIVVEYIVG